MDIEPDALWATRLEEVRRRADVATAALFEVRARLDLAADRWESVTGGFPTEQLLRMLAQDCDRAWRAAIDVDGATQTGAIVGSRWPWGTHETKLLCELAAAATHWWVNYDPLDNTTAPTNEDVSQWLQRRGVVGNAMANKMATMLRADGLRTGPRT